MSAAALAQRTVDNIRYAGGRLFVTQRLDRIEVGCAIRRVESEADADGGADEKAGDGPAVGEDDVHLEPSCQQVASDDSKNDSEDSAGFRNEHGFGEELTQNVATARADRFTHTDFLRSFGDAHEHDVHDPDPGSHQRNEADDECTDAHDACDRSERAF